MDSDKTNGTFTQYTYFMLISAHSSEQDFLLGAALNKIVSSENLDHYKGCGLSPNVRLFIFKQQPGAFAINFITQKLRDNSIAIVPPMQLHFLSPIECGDYICIEVPENVLNVEDFVFMSRFIYATQKHLQLGKLEGFDYEQFKKLLVNDYNYQATLQLLKGRIEKSYPNRLGKPDFVSIKYLALAKEFESRILGIKLFTLDDTIISQYTDKLICSEKALCRACAEVFRATPKDILKHHLLVRSIPMLFNKNYNTELIAAKLGYSSLSAFTKFIKKQTDTTPGKIRSLLHSVLFENQTD